MKAKRLSDGGIAWWCPACDRAHRSDGRWQFNGDFNAPTFNPSFNVAPIVDDKGHVLRPRCHSTITDGRAAFANDSGHALAGKTVDIPDWPFSA